MVWMLLLAQLLGCGQRKLPQPVPSVDVQVPADGTAVPTAAPGGKPLEHAVIGIDPGHQEKKNTDKEPNAPGSDVMKNKVSAGATGRITGVREYAINLEIGLRLQAMLEAAGATVVMTRTTHDVNISNVERAQLMNEANVDLVLRLHCNGAEDTERRGAYMLVPAADCTAFYDENLRAAECLLTAYCDRSGVPAAARHVSERDDQTGFNWCTRPVVNIEMGYLSNAEDEAILSDPANWDAMAEGLYNGLAAYFGTTS